MNNELLISFLSFFRLHISQLNKYQLTNYRIIILLTSRILVILFFKTSEFSRLQQCEEDKATKDSQIRSLKQELTSQEELVSKLQREKKAWADGRQQKEEELQAAEDKANHLSKIKMKLEQNLDELEDSVEREKKVIFIGDITKEKGIFSIIYQINKY